MYPPAGIGSLMTRPSYFSILSLPPSIHPVLTICLFIPNTYQVKIMGMSAIFAGCLLFVQRDMGLEGVWEALLAFQVARAGFFAYRFWDPWGPVRVERYCYHLLKSLEKEEY